MQNSNIKTTDPSHIEIQILNQIRLSFCFLTCLFSFVGFGVYAIFLKKLLPQNQFHSSILARALLWIFFFASISFILKFLLKKNISPVFQAFQCFQKKADLKQIKKPDSLPVVLAPLYEDINDFLSKLTIAQEETIELEKRVAIVRITKLLSHDIRKPFSMLEMALGILKNATCIDKVKEICHEMLPEIQNGMAKINDAVQDILEVGGQFFPSNLTECKVQSILLQSLQDVFTKFESATVNIHYNLEHNSYVFADYNRIVKVFTHLIANAAQAMKLKGNIILSTKNIITDNKKFVVMSVINDGPILDSSVEKRMYDAFYTKDKSKGAGVGLTLCQKIVDAHGGEISYTQVPPGQSHPGNVEFSVKLPACDKPDSPNNYSLPIDVFSCKNSKQYKLNNIVNIENQQPKYIIKDNTHNISMLILDDEKIYSTAIANMIENYEEIQPKINIDIAIDDEQAIFFVQEKKFDIMIVDVDLETSLENGFSLVNRFRRDGVKSFICIHSNRTCPSDEKFAYEMGADAYVPKPMSRENLLNLVLASLARKAIQV